jgi:23S rRNA pseudouridine1911/1915/1917 synthase
MFLVAGPADDGGRLDRFVSGQTGITRSQVRQIAAAGRISVNGNPAKASYTVKAGDRVDFSLPEPENDELVAEDIPLDVRFRDRDIIVVNKPAGLVVHPAAGNRRGTLMNALKFHVGSLAGIGGPLRPGVVHRLDKDTSGLLMVALTDRAYYALVEQFKERTVERRYVALVWGSPREDRGEITRGIGRSTSNRKKMSTRTRRAREAKTSWEVLRRFGPATLVAVRLGTGRTHQVRVHLAAIGHPVMGDRTYGRKTSLRLGRKTIGFPRQMLHAETLGITHPVTGERLSFTAPLPGDMEQALEQLSEATGRLGSK